MTEKPSTSYRPQAAVSRIKTGELDLTGMLAKAHDPKAGAVVLFSGEVRNHNVGKQVSHLEYEAHTPLAEKMMEEILQKAQAKFDLHFADCMHRIGRLDIGESAVVVVTSSSHRKEAYQANQYIIHRIKHEAPIWKCEYYEDGSHAWGNNCNC